MTVPKMAAQPAPGCDCTERLWADAVEFATMALASKSPRMMRTAGDLAAASERFAPICATCDGPGDYPLCPKCETAYLEALS